MPTRSPPIKPPSNGGRPCSARVPQAQPPHLPRAAHAGAKQELQGGQAAFEKGLEEARQAVRTAGEAAAQANLRNSRTHQHYSMVMHSMVRRGWGLRGAVCGDKVGEGGGRAFVTRG